MKKLFQPGPRAVEIAWPTQPVSNEPIDWPTQPVSNMPAAADRRWTRGSIQTIETIETFQSAPSNRTMVSPDWEPVPLPDDTDEPKKEAGTSRPEGVTYTVRQLERAQGDTTRERPPQRTTTREYDDFRGPRRVHEESPDNRRTGSIRTAWPSRKGPPQDHDGLRVRNIHIKSQTVLSPPPVISLRSLIDFPLWRAQIAAVAQLLMCDEFLARTSAPAEPAEVPLSPNYKNFALHQSALENVERHRSASKRATNLVVKHLGPTFLEELKPIIEKDGYQAWELIELLDQRATYSIEQVALGGMMNRLMDMRYQEGSDISVHIAAFRAALDALEPAGVTFNASTRAMMLVSSLPRTPAWKEFQDALLASATADAPLSFNVVETALLRRTGQLSSDSPMVEANSLFVSLAGR